MESLQKAQLRSAVNSEDIDTIREILSFNPKLGRSFSEEISFDESDPLLWDAVFTGNSEIVELLIKFGADVNETKVIVNNDDYGVPDDYIQSLLHWMSDPEDMDDTEFLNVAKVLISHGADVNAFYDDSTPLKEAIELGNFLYSKFLLKNGARLEGPEWDGDNSVLLSIILAPIVEQKKLLQVLFKYGLNSKYRNSKGENHLHLFVNSHGREMSYHPEIIEVLLNAGVSLDETENSGHTPLGIAVGIENAELVSLLIQKGADVNKGLPLETAIFLNNLNLVNLLVSNGAEVNIKNDDGFSMLHRACLNDTLDERMINFLIQKGADITAQTWQGSTALTFLMLQNKDEPSIFTMIKEYSKLLFEKFLISRTDIRLIQKNERVHKHYSNCMAELDRMANTQFYPPYSYYSVLRMSKNIIKLANLTENKHFVNKFEANLSFPLYVNHLKSVFDEAIRVRDETQLVYWKLSSVIGNYLPGILIKKFAENLTLEDLPFK